MDRMFSLLATTDRSYTKTSYKNTVWDLKLPCACSYTVRLALSDDKTPKKGTVVVLNTGAGSSFIRKLWLLCQLFCLIEKVPEYSFTSAETTPI